MIGKTTAGFWSCFDRLPSNIQSLARQKYKIWREDPFHPSLHFKEIHPGLWSVRVNAQYRSLARRRGDSMVWFWIGTHGEYDRLIGHP
jgi:hypothetical protein